MEISIDMYIDQFVWFTLHILIKTCLHTDSWCHWCCATQSCWVVTKTFGNRTEIMRREKNGGNNGDKKEITRCNLDWKEKKRKGTPSSQFHFLSFVPSKFFPLTCSFVAYFLLQFSLRFPLSSCLFQLFPSILQDNGYKMRQQKIYHLTRGCNLRQLMITILSPSSPAYIHAHYSLHIITLSFRI